jgi:hypothetical protein
MHDAAIVPVTHVLHAAATAAPAGGGSSTLLVVTVAGIAVFVTARVMTTALKVFSALLGAAVKIGTAVIALGFGTLVLGVVYVANVVFNFVPS